MNKLMFPNAQPSYSVFVGEPAESDFFFDINPEPLVVIEQKLRYLKEVKKITDTIYVYNDNEEIILEVK